MANRTVSVNLVANIGQYVSGMNAAAGATMRLGDTATTTTKKAQSGFDLAGKGALLMGAAVVGGMAMAVSKSMEFEKAMSGAAAATRASGAALGDLRDAAMKAGADTQYSATEAAQAITEMGKAGVSTADILNGGLDGALALAAAGQLDVAKAAEIASVAMTQFKLSGDQLPHVADLLAAGAGKAMGSVEDLGMALNQAGLVASSTGLSIEETTGSLAAFASAGLIGSDAGTSLRSMLLHLQNATGPAQAAMDEYGISLYDAAGNFVGMEALAGQLETKLGGLTQETRDAAMAQIFGSDAVRAANVLYTEGAAGIADWTSKVNDQGYAAEQAAKLNDNLAGDLEKLGGAFETLMITMGEGAQGPLRALVQGLGDVVDGVTWLAEAWQSLPGSVQVALIAVGAFLMLKGPLTSFAETAYLKLLMAKDAVGGFGSAATAARTSLMSLVTAAAPMAAVAAIAWAATKTYEFATAAGDAREEIAGMWDAVDDARGVAQLNALADVVDQIRDKIRGLREELPETKGAFEGLLSPLGMLEDGAAVNALSEYEDALKSAQEAQKQTAITVDLLGDRFGLTKQQVLDMASKYNIDLAGGLSNARRLFQNFYSTEFGAKPTEATIGLSTAMDDAKQSIDDAKDAVDGFKLSLDILTGAHVSMIEVESAFEAAVADADGALKDMNGSVLNGAGNLNMQSESGRAAADVLLDVRDSGNQLIATMIQQGATTDQVRAKDAQLRESFINSAIQMGISRQAAENLANQILGIPAERTTKIDADTAAANDKIAATQRGIDNMHGKDIEIRVRAAGRFIINPQGGLQEFAEGGWTGPGSKYQPAGIVHADEFVVPKNRVRALGGPQAVGSLVGMPGYADGGPVLPINILSDSRQVEGVMAEVATAIRNAVPKEPPAGSGGSSTGLLPIMAAARAYVQSTYGINNIGGFSNRNIAGTNVKSDHAMGKAIDIMTTNLGLGWQIANDFAYGPAHSRFRAENVIWQQSISSNGGRFTGMADRGSPTQNHRDHVHVDTYATGTPYVPRDGLAYIHKGEAVVPAHINARSREFSGGGGRAPIVVNVTPNLEGARITGQVAFDPAGVLRLTDARIDAKFGEITDTVHYAGG